MGAPEQKIRRRVPVALAYLLAVALTTVSMFLRLALGSRFGDDPALELFLIPIVLSAYVGGLGPELLATALIAVLTNYLFLPPKYTFSIQSGLHSVEWVVLILAGTLTCLLMESQRRSPPSPAQEERSLAWTEWKIRAAFALALAVLIVIAGMSYFSLVRLHEDRMLVDHTYQVIASLRLVPASFAEAQAAIRGYIITGDEDFLQRLQKALADVDAEMQSLRSLTGGDAVQQRRLDTLAAIIAQRLELIQRAVEVRRREGFAPAQQMVASRKGEQFHQRIVAVVAEMETTEQNLLQQRDTRARRAGIVARTVIVAGISLAFVFVAVALFIINRDFTGNRQAQAALKEAHDLLEARVLERTAELAKARDATLNSEARLAGVLNSAMDAIISVDDQQHIVLFNPAAEKMFGRHAADLMGQPLDVCIPERFHLAHAQHQRAFSETGITQRQMGELGSVFGLRANGEEFPIEASISRVNLGGQRLLTAILRDVTDRVRAEKSLRDSEQRFRLLLDSTEEAILGEDLEGNCTFCNPASARLVGYDHAAELLGKNVHATIHHSGPDGTPLPIESCPMHRALKTGQRCHTDDLVFWRKDGTSFVAECWLHPIFQDGKSTGAVLSFLDITERKRAEQDLRDREAELTAIYENAPVAMLLVDSEHRIRKANRFAEQFTVSGDLSGLRYGEALHCLHTLDEPRGCGFQPDCQDCAVRNKVLDTLATGRSHQQLEVRLPFAVDGSIRDAAFLLATSRLSILGQALVLVTIQDITERKRSEEALQESEERLLLFVEHAPAALAMFDREMRYLRVSRRWLADYGLGDRDVRGLSHYEIFPDIPARWREAHRRGLAGEVLRQESDRFERADGDMRWIRWEIRPWHETRGDIGGIVIFTEDITERKRSESALRESEERLQRVTEGMTEGLVISDMEGELTHWNPAAVEMHGFTSSEVWRRQLPELKDIFELSTLDGTVVPFEQWPFPRIYRGDRLREYELRVRRIDRDWERVFSYGGTIVRDSTGKQMAFCTIADVTERKRAEEEIRLLNRDLERRVAQRTAELQAANKELESFSYSVAHDLRAPLRAVDGFSDALMEDYGPQLPEQAREYLQTIRRGAQRMGALIDDLLAFSRLNRQALTKQTVDMELLVHGVLEDALPEGKDRTIEIVDGTLPVANGDPALLRQVWINLISNAIKYSRHAQQARIEIGALSEGKKNVYYVRDNGAGFDMKYADKLFGVFQRLHRAEEFEGTGIGLAIVQRVVHRHGGRVWAEAKVNQGATFYFTLEGGTANG